MNMHKPDEAFTYLQRSLMIKEKASIDISRYVGFSTTLTTIGQCLIMDVDFSTTLNDIGRCLMDMHKPDEAFAYLQRSLTIKDEA